MECDFVIFDASGTLIHGEPTYTDLYIRACRDCGFDVTEDAIARGLVAAWEPFNRAGGALPRGINAGPDVYTAWEHHLEMSVLRHAGLNGDLDAATRRVIELKRTPTSWTVYPDTRPALEALSEAGKGMAVISNWDWSLQDLLQEMDLLHYFGFVLVSAQFGFAKPHPSIFARALDLAGALASRVVYVGDDYEFDISPAARAGMSAIMVDRKGKADGRCVAIESLDALPALLELSQAA